MKKVHFIAIGGSAMHNLAIALLEKGYLITGSDDVIYEPSRTRLEKRDILPKELGWFPDKITKDLDAVILGMHAQSDNVELLRAQELGLKIYSYPEYLYEQSKNKTRVVIGGSHGKTTITSMILHVLHYHNIDVDYMVGAQLDGFDVMVKLSNDNEFMIMEGDEYLSSTLDRRSKFLLYHPNIALISGIAWDHINVFPTFESYTYQFTEFVNSIVNGGSLIYNETDRNVIKVVDDSKKFVKKFPYNLPKYFINNGITFIKTEDGPIPLEVFGNHNLMNLEGAREVCKQLGILDGDFNEAIQSFKGASRRLELINKTQDFIAYKDFAHSPSKVNSVVNAVKNQYKDKTLVGCLEIHTYSSLNPEFIIQYRGTLDRADIKIVMNCLEALENKKMQIMSTEEIKKAFNDESILVFTSSEQLHSYIESFDKSNKVFLMMSSGNFGGLNLEKLFKE